jgi:tetratricopeptide (TPR) repeat protein
MEPVAEHTLQLAEWFAFQGEYLAAHELLKHAAVSPADKPRVHMLNGKIAAQQGEFDQAIREWEEVLKMEPDNAEAQAAIEKAEALKSARRRKFYLRANLYYAVLSGAVLICLLAAAFFCGRSTRQEASPVLEQIARAQERQAGLTSKAVDAISESISSAKPDKESLIRLETILGGISRDIGALEKRLSDLPRDIGALDKRLSDLSRDVADVKGLKGSVESVQKELQAKIDELKTAQDTSTGDIANKLSDLTKRLEAEVSKGEESRSAIKKDVAALGEQVAARYENLLGQMDKFSSEVQSQFDRISKALDSLRRRLW